MCRDEVKQERWDRFMEKAQAISEAKLAAKVGRRMTVLVDAVDGEGATCRTMADAHRDRRQPLHRRRLRRAGAGRPRRGRGGGSERIRPLGPAVRLERWTCPALHSFHDPRHHHLPPDRESAERLARAALAEHVTACANIIEGVAQPLSLAGRDRRGQRSVGYLQRHRTRRVAALVAFLEAEHPYDVPVITWERLDTTKDAADWLARETH